MTPGKLWRWVESPVRVLDIGAGTGVFARSVLAAHPECKVVMVEANPNCEESLAEVGAPYDLVALSDREGRADLHVELSNPVATGASLYRENTPWYADGRCHSFSVPTATLDSRGYFPGERIDLVKMDVQGSELDIIRGGPETMARAGWALVEVSLVEYNRGAPLMEEVVEHMLSLGFRIADVVGYHRFPHLYGGACFQLDVLFGRQ